MVSLDSPSSRESDLKRMASGEAGVPTTRARPPPSVATQILPSGVGLERVDGVGWEAGRIGGVVPEHLDHRAVRPCEIEAAVVRADPHVALGVLGEWR